MSESLPKIRTSMQMSQASIEALRSLAHHPEVPPSSPPLLPKKILKIPHFHLVNPPPSDQNPKPERKVVAFDRSKKAFSVVQSPVSDPTHKPDLFEQALKQYDYSRRRCSAQVPETPHLFKEDILRVASPTPAVPLHIVPAMNPVSSDEVDDSSQSEGITSPPPKRSYRLSKTPRATMAPIRYEGPALLEYSIATARVLTSTRDLMKRHMTQKIPARLLKF
jgi:hypothetical protein